MDCVVVRAVLLIAAVIVGGVLGGVSGDMTVHIANQLSNDLILIVHCRSNNDDLSELLVPVNMEIRWHFYAGLSTLFWCDLAVQDKRLHFVAFPPPDDIKVDNMSTPWVVDLQGVWLSGSLCGNWTS
ncbi:hypothetical protein LINGRAHAP2_LOCUS8908 [Linum grandiflorum]